MPDDNRTARARPAFNHIRAALDYDPNTGIFVWRWRSDIGNNLNARYAGNRAGSLAPHGYRKIRINGQIEYEHSLAWLYVTGEWPSLQVDHINGEPADNRFVNLRLATSSQQHYNARRRRDGCSGHRGVHKSRKRWIAAIHVEGCRHYLGTFATPEIAAAAYAQAATKHYGSFWRGAD